MFLITPGFFKKNMFLSFPLGFFLESQYEQKVPGGMHFLYLFIEKNIKSSMCHTSLWN